MNKFNEILSATGTAVLKKRAEIINADAAKQLRIRLISLRKRFVRLSPRL